MERRGPPDLDLGFVESWTPVPGRFPSYLAEHMEGVEKVVRDDPGWQEAPADVFQARVRAAFDAAPDGWVADGNYRSKLGSLVLERADTVVILEPPFHVAFGRALRRTIARAIMREELWNGNREQIRHLFTRDWIPWWVLRTHRHYAREVPKRVAEHPHLAVMHLKSQREVAELLDSIEPWAARV